MSKKAILIGTGGFILGLAIGVVGKEIYDGKSVADGLFLMKELEVARSGEEAFKGYQHESIPVAIYALKQHLITLNHAEDVGGDNPVFMGKVQILRETAFTHTRLSRLYTQEGEADLSAEHMAQSLHYIAQTDRYAGITNEATMLELVAKFDQHGLP